MNKIKINVLKKILDNLEINKGDNIYLGIDFFKTAKTIGEKKITSKKFVDLFLNYFLKRLGKKGNLIIPVFNFNCVGEKKFNQKTSAGQSGALGNMLLKKYFYLRTDHPFYSFLCFGNKLNTYKKVKDINATGKNSLWKYFIQDNFSLVTLGHHYSRSFTHVHYLESLSKVNYRYNKKFSLKYTNLNNKISKKTYSFFARRKNICDFSGITKKCDNFLIKQNIAKFFKYKKFISFKLDIKSASKIILDDLNKKSINFVYYINKNKKNTNVISNKSILSLEKLYINKKSKK